MNAYVTIHDKGPNVDQRLRYSLVITVAHSAYNIVQLSAGEARDLINAGIPVTQP